MAHYSRFFLVSLLALVMNASFALQSYKATYKISVRGVSAGIVRHNAIFTDLTYRLDTAAKPSVAAKMLGFGEIHETVTGLLKQGRVVPQRYQRNMEGDAEFRLVYDFNTKQHSIAAQIGNNERMLKYDEGIQPLDALSLIIQTLINEEQKKIVGSYALVNEDKIRVYDVEKLPEEIWQTPDGHSLVIRVFRQTSGDRQTKIYLADHPLRLVKLAQTKGDQVRFSLKLIDYRII